MDNRAPDGGVVAEGPAEPVEPEGRLVLRAPAPYHLFVGDECQEVRRHPLAERRWPRASVVVKAFWAPGKRGLD